MLRRLRMLHGVLTTDPRRHDIWLSRDSENFRRCCHFGIVILHVRLELFPRRMNTKRTRSSSYLLARERPPASTGGGSRFRRGHMFLLQLFDCFCWQWFIEETSRCDQSRGHIPIVVSRDRSIGELRRLERCTLTFPQCGRLDSDHWRSRD